MDAEASLASNAVYSRSMQSPPFFSIIMPTFNRAGLLGRSLASVLAQDETAWELLIADDGSTDETWPLLRTWQAADSRIRCWKHGNRGQAAARNVLLGHALAPWIVFLDSDDEFEPAHLSKRREAIAADGEVDLWISPMRVVGDPLVPCSQHHGEMIHLDKCVGVGMIVVRREAIMAIGGFPEMAYAEDTAMINRLLLAGVRTGQLAQRSYVYHRDHADTVTHNQREVLEAMVVECAA